MPPIDHPWPLYEMENDDDDDDMFHSSRSYNEASLSDTISASSPDKPVNHDTLEITPSGKQLDEFLTENDFEVEDSQSSSDYTLESVIQEAKEHYMNEKPDFCVKSPSNQLREIQLIEREEKAEIHFQQWDNDCGYWTYTDGIQDTYIVKWRSHAYFVWEGVEKGYASYPFAKAIKTSAKSSSQRSTSSISSLRDRTVRQRFPYTMYNAEKVSDQKGVKLTEARLERIVQDSKNLSEPVSQSKKRKQGHDRGNSSIRDDESKPRRRFSKAEPAIEISDEEVLKNTTLRTQLDGFGKATIPITGDKCASHSALFAVIKQKWAFKLQKHVLSYCIVKFPWHGDDKNLLLQESDEDGYKNMLDEIRENVLWQSDRRTEVVVEVYAE